MTRLPKNTGVIFMNKITGGSGIIYMSKPSLNPEAPGGGVGTGLTWVKWKSNVYWDGAWSSWGWNFIPGNNMWAGAVLWVPAGYNYIKVTYVADYWTSGGVNYYTLGIKGYIDAGGFGATITVDATREIRVGNYTPSGTGSNQIKYDIWIAK